MFYSSQNQSSLNMFDNTNYHYYLNNPDYYDKLEEPLFYLYSEISFHLFSTIFLMLNHSEMLIYDNPEFNFVVDLNTISLSFVFSISGIEASLIVFDVDIC